MTNLIPGISVSEPTSGNFSSTLKMLDRQTDWFNVSGGQAGVEPDTVEVITAVEFNNSEVYKNPGFDTDDFSSPDFTRVSKGSNALELISGSVIAVQTGGDNRFLQGLYEISMKILVTYSGGSPATVSIEESRVFFVSSQSNYERDPEMAISVNTFNGTVVAVNNDKPSLQYEGVWPALSYTATLTAPSPSNQQFTESYTATGLDDTYESNSAIRVESDNVIDGEWSAAVEFDYIFYDLGAYFLDFNEPKSVWSPSKSLGITYEFNEELIDAIWNVYCNMSSACGSNKHDALRERYNNLMSMYSMYKEYISLGNSEKADRLEADILRISQCKGCGSC